MFRWVLVAVWALIFGSVALLGLFPKLAARVPHPKFLFIFLFAFILISLVYGVSTLYRHGMKRAKTNSADGPSHHYDAPR
jgi:membrane associated rhomboid family serine protease